MEALLFGFLAGLGLLAAMVVFSWAVRVILVLLILRKFK